MPDSLEIHETVQENSKNMTLFNFPKGFLKLISVANVETTLDSFNVFLHSCALDVGFLPKNIEEDDVYNLMPDDWKTSGAWKFQYQHKSCPDLFCYVTCIPFYSYIAIHGAISDGVSKNSIYLKLKTTDYLKEHTGPKVVEEFFKNTRSLERKFKDRFCFALLAELQGTAGCAPTFGFCAAVDEVKTQILQLLPVESIIAMSCVNKDCNRTANSSFLWKHILIRDFGLVDDQSASSDGNYKELYKKEYTKRKRRARVVPFPFNPNPFFRPPLIPHPPDYIDVRRDLDPAIQQAFPYLRDRFRPNALFPPYGFPGWFM